jgi:hypothetical protein
MYQIHKKTNTEVFIKSEMTGELTRLKLIKKHSVLGNFYVFNSILSMPYQRKLMFDLIQQYNTLGIDKEELIKENTEILKMLENREQGFEMKIYSKIASITNTAKSFWDYKKSSMLITSLLIIPESELDMIGYFDQDKAEENIKEWSRDSDLLGFFLNIAQQKTNNLLSKFEHDTQNYLAEELLNGTEHQQPANEEKLSSKILNKLKTLLKK